MSIPSHHLRWFSALVRQLYSARTHAEMNRVLLPALHRRFGLINAMCESATLDFTQMSLDGVVSDYETPKDHHLHMGDCPALLRLMKGDRSPQMHLWDAGPNLERTDFYNLLCRPYRARDQVLNVVWGTARLTGYSVIRDTLFAPAERTMCILLHPHLTAALRRVEAHRPPTAAPFGNPWVLVDSTGQPLGLTAAQNRVFSTYFPMVRRDPRHWPESVGRWVGAVRRALATTPLLTPPAALQVASSRGRLGLRYFPNAADNGGSVRLIESPAAPSWPILGARAGLSPRECEVLHWLAQGKRDSEIARILDLSTATASRHTHNILRKLGVGSRSAVVAALVGRN